VYLTAIDRTIPQKLYFQLLEILQGHIETGGWKVGSQIPTEDQLCSQYNVSKATVRLAVAELVSLGYLKKFQAKAPLSGEESPATASDAAEPRGRPLSRLHRPHLRAQIRPAGRRDPRTVEPGGEHAVSFRSAPGHRRGPSRA